jgi:hypothetical protein
MRVSRAESQSSDHHSNLLNLLWQIRSAAFGYGVFTDAPRVKHLAEFETIFRLRIIPRIAAAAIPRAESA